MNADKYQPPRRNVIGPRALLFALPVATLLSGCGVVDLTVEQARQKHAEILARDPPPDFGQAPVTVELAVYDAATKAPVRELLISGRATGSLKQEYVGYPEAPFICHFLPFLCIAEHDRSLREISTSIAASRVTQSGDAPSTYTVHTPGGFALSPGLKQLSNDVQWYGSLSSRGHCSPERSGLTPRSWSSDWPIVQATATPNLGGASPSTGMTIPMQPLELNAFTRMHYHLQRASDFVWPGSPVKLSANPPVAGAYADVVGWARPTSDDPFEHAVYASLLIETARALRSTSPRDETAISILSEKIEQSLPIGRRMYYQFDDWQLVPATERVEWHDDSAAEDIECTSPATEERLMFPGQLGEALPVLPARDYFVEKNAVTPSVLQLKRYPFCFRHQPLSATRARPLHWTCPDSQLSPEISSRPTDGAQIAGPASEQRPVKLLLPATLPPEIGPTRHGYDKDIYDDPNASCAQREQAARHRAALLEFSVQCRYGAPAKCNLNAVNGLGDTALMTLARVDSLQIGSRYPFARAPATREPKHRYGSANFSRSQAAAMVRALLEAGADAVRVNPALDVNALELAISPFLAGGMRSRDPGDWDAQKHIVEALVAAFKRDRNGSIRVDFLEAVAGYPASTPNHGTQKVPPLPSDLVDQVRNLPQRAMREICGTPVKPWDGRIQPVPTGRGGGPIPPLALRR